MDSRLIAAGVAGGLLLYLNSRAQPASAASALSPAGFPTRTTGAGAGVLDLTALAPGQVNPPDPVIKPPPGPTLVAVVNASAVRSSAVAPSTMVYPQVGIAPQPPRPSPPPPSTVTLPLTVQRQVSLQQPRINPPPPPPPPPPPGPTVWTRTGPRVLPPLPTPPLTGLPQSVQRQASLQRR